MSALVLLSAPQYDVSTIAGSALPVTPAAALSSSIGNTDSVARDANGDLYFSSSESVFKVDSNGVLTLMAGNGASGYSGDGGLAIHAQLSNPWGVAVDHGGNIYIADELNNRIRRVSPAGIITTVAGSGAAVLGGDGGPATQAGVHFPLNVTVDAAGNLYIAEYFDGRVREVSPAGIINTIAGGGPVYPGDGGLATASAIAGPGGMAMDAAGNRYIADRNGMRVRKISTNGIISTVAGNGTAGYSGDGGLAIDAEMYLPSDVAVDAAGNLYIADFNNNRIRIVSPAGIISTYAPTAVLSGPSGLALDPAGNLYVADRFDNLIQKISTSGIAEPVAGNGTLRFAGDGGPAVSALLNTVSGVAADQFGNIFIADQMNGRVREVLTSGVITTFAGGGNSSGDGVPANSARLVYPNALTFDPEGNLYIADSGTERIRKVSTSGVITTVAGNGTQGSSGDGGPAASAELFNPSGVAADGSGNVYILDNGKAGTSVRQVSPSGTITTLLAAPSLAQGGTAANPLYGPTGIAVDASGTLYIAEETLLPTVGSGEIPRPFRIEKVSQGTFTTFAQTGGGPITADGSGDLYTMSPNGIEKIAADGTVELLVVTGTIGGANAIAAGPGSTIYLAEQYSVLLVQPTGGAPVTSPVMVSAVFDAASESAAPVSPGKIVAIYGSGFGSPLQAASNVPSNGVFGTSLNGTTVAFNGIAAPILYAGPTQIIAVTPYEITGASAQVVVSYQLQSSNAVSVPLAATAPSLFTSNQTGAGEVAAVNDADGTLNSAVNPVKIGDYISLFATGEGQTSPPGADGATGGSTAARPIANVGVTVGGVAAEVQYAGGVSGDVAGLMQINVPIPAGVPPGGYVPVVLTVGNAASNSGTWIAVAGN